MAKRPKDPADDPDTTPGPTGPAPTPDVPRPTRGRIIDYTDGENRVSPAIVTEVIDSVMNICAFDPVFGPRNYHIAEVDACRRALPGEADTWNWPVRV
jgi:hypothetical protein